MTLVTIFVVAICATIVLYILYSVIWHAVRRGMEEFHHPVPATAHHVARRVKVRVPDYPPSDWV